MTREQTTTIANESGAKSRGAKTQTGKDRSRATTFTHLIQPCPSATFSAVGRNWSAEANMRAIAYLTFSILLGSGALLSQTKLDLSTQSKNVDFSQAASTKPMRVGTALPASCQVGEAYFRSNATAGQNLYLCVATNSWALQTGTGQGSGTSLPTTSGQDNVFLIGNSADQAAWRRLTTGASGAIAITHNSTESEWEVTSLTPMKDAANVWNGMNAWTPTTVQTLSAGTAMLCNGNQIQVTATAPLTLTATPTIADGVAGSTCTITNVGTNAITLQDETALGGSNLRLPGSTVAIPSKQSIQLAFNSTLSQWTMVGGSGSGGSGGGGTTVSVAAPYLLVGSTYMAGGMSVTARPDTLTWSDVNIAGLTVSTPNQSMTLIGTDGSSTRQIRGKSRPLPSDNDVQLLVNCQATGDWTGDSSGCAFGLRNSGNGALVVWTLHPFINSGAYVSTLSLTSWLSPASIQYSSSNEQRVLWSGPVLLRIYRDAGKNKYVDLCSPTGDVCTLLASRLFGPDQADSGAGVDSYFVGVLSPGTNNSRSIGSMQILNVVE